MSENLLVFQLLHIRNLDETFKTPVLMKIHQVMLRQQSNKPPWMYQRLFLTKHG